MGATLSRLFAPAIRTRLLASSEGTIMERHLIVVAGTAALALFAVSPSYPNVKNADRVQRTTARTETLKAQRRAAIAELCPDDTLSSGQRNCERMARRAADAEPTGVKNKQ